MSMQADSQNQTLLEKLKVDNSISEQSEESENRESSAMNFNATQAEQSLRSPSGLIDHKGLEVRELLSPSQLIDRAPSTSLSSTGERHLGVLNRTTTNSKVSFGSHPHQPQHLSNQVENERITEEDSEGLDQEDKEFLNKYFQKSQRNLGQSTEDFILSTQEITRSVTKMSQYIDGRERRVTTVAEAQERLKKEPYSDCIKQFRKVSSTFSPSDKLDLITKVCALVDQNIQQFWDGVQIKTEKLHLTADQYLAIFMYIVVKSRIKDLEAQMYLIEQFTDDYTLNVTKEGYMFLTVKQSIEFLKYIDEDKVAQEGYLAELIVQRRKYLAARATRQLGSTSTHQTLHEASFNIFNNPNSHEQSLVLMPLESRDIL